MLSVKLLGGFEVTLNGKPLVLPRRHARLLAYLLLNPGRHSRVVVADVFWPDEGEARLSNLRHNIYALRQALGESDRNQVRLLGHDDIRFQKQPNDRIDVLQFDQVDLANADLPSLIELANSYNEPSQDVVDFFTASRLERIVKKQSNILARIADCYAEQNDLKNALVWADKRIQHDPQNEIAYIEAMRLQAEAGSEEGVMAVMELYERNSEVIASMRLRQAYDRFTAQARKNAETGILPNHNLPHFETPLVGRAKELELLVHNLCQPSQKILTVAGMGGMGKTRLATEAARRALRHFQDGVCFVSMNQVETVTELVMRIAQALEYRLFPGNPPEQQLINRLSSKNILLVLDGFERTLASNADRPSVSWLDQLVLAADDLKIIVTSRERLLSPNETVIDLLGLAVPVELDDPHASQCESVDLFQRLASRRMSEDMPLPDIARICQLVEGMPLALELAASWVRIHSCAQIAEGIAQHFDLVAASLDPQKVKDNPQQVSLRASFEYSWEQMSPQECLLFMKLTTFESSCSSEAAKAVAEASGGSLLALADKSFIHRESTGYFAIHDLLRQFGREKFKDPLYIQDYQITQQHFIRYFVGFAQQQQNALLAGYDKLDMEWINLLAAIRLAHTLHAWRAVMDLAHALTDAWDDRSRYTDALIGHGLAVEAASALNLRPMLLRSLRWQGRMLLEQGQYDEASALYQRALSMAYDEEDEVEIAWVKYDQAWNALEQGQLHNCNQLITESMSILKEYDHVAKLPEILNLLARLRLQQGNFLSAIEVAEQARALLEPNGPSTNLARTYKWLSEAYQDLKAWDKAHEYANHAMTTSEAVKDLFSVASSQYTLARIHYASNHQSKQGLELAQKAYRTFLHLGTKRSALYAKGFTGLLNRRLGNILQAKDILTQCLAELRTINDLYACVNYGMYLGDVFEDLGSPETACAHWQQALADIAHLSDKKHPFEGDLTERLRRYER